MILGLAHAVAEDGKSKKGQQTLEMSSSSASTSTAEPFKSYGWLYVGSHNLYVSDAKPLRRLAALTSLFLRLALQLLGVDTARKLAIFR